jgi:hypothetical protein
MRIWREYRQRHKGVTISRRLELEQQETRPEGLEF